MRQWSAARKAKAKEIALAIDAAELFLRVEPGRGDQRSTIPTSLRRV